MSILIMCVPEREEADLDELVECISDFDSERRTGNSPSRDYIVKHRRISAPLHLLQPSQRINRTKTTYSNLQMNIHILRLLQHPVISLAHQGDQVCLCHMAQFVQVEGKVLPSRREDDRGQDRHHRASVLSGEVGLDLREVEELLSPHWTGGDSGRTTGL